MSTLPKNVSNLPAVQRLQEQLRLSRREATDLAGILEETEPLAVYGSPGRVFLGGAGGATVAAVLRAALPDGWSAPATATLALVTAAGGGWLQRGDVVSGAVGMLAPVLERLVHAAITTTLDARRAAKRATGNNSNDNANANDGATT